MILFQSTTDKNLAELKAQKKQTNYNMKMILNQSTVNKNPAQLISSELFSTVSWLKLII